MVEQQRRHRFRSANRSPIVAQLPHKTDWQHVKTHGIPPFPAHMVEGSKYLKQECIYNGTL